MKVGVAAKILSNRVASSILSWCLPSGLLSADAIHTEIKIYQWNW